MKLSVNILTWNTAKTLVETLSILKQELEGIDSEVIIVDNGSNDGCQNIATIKNEKNLGVCKGKNQGIDASNGDYIMLIDGDIVPVPNSIRCLVAHLDANPDCEAIGFLPNKFTNHKNRNGQMNHETFCHKLEPIQPYRGHCIYYGIYRREVFGPGKVRFDEAYGPGYGFEDLDSYMQMEALGIKQYTAGINHLCGKYYHEVNSSHRAYGKGSFDWYMSTQRARQKIFESKWQGVHVVG